MKVPENAIKSLLAVFTQFWRTDKAYSLLLNVRSAGMVMIATVVVISMAGYVPAMLANWNEIEEMGRGERLPVLEEEGFTPAQADSVNSDNGR